MRTADRCHGGFVLLHPKPSGLPRRPDYASISLHAGTENHPLGIAPPRHTRSRHVASFTAADPVRLIQEEIPIAQRRLCVLIDGKHDRLDVLIAPALTRP